MSCTIKPAIAAGLLVALGACGGSSGSSSGAETEIVTETAFGANPSGLTVTLNDPNDPSAGVTVSDGATSRQYNLVTNISGPITAYQSELGVSGYSDWVLLGETSSGGGVARLINETVPAADEPGMETLVVELERIGSTFVPTTGDTSYSGSYLGQLYQDVPDGEQLVYAVGLDRITGTVTLTADFDDMMISGMITNRTGYQDITLEDGTITGGGFTGTASGGEGLVGLATESVTSGGTYSGLFTGSDASEVIGGLSLDHALPDDLDPEALVTEYGVFIAED